MDNYRTTSSDACFALSRVISDGAQKLYANKKDSMKVKVAEIPGGSEEDRITNLKLAMSTGNWKGEHKQSYRAMFVNGR